MVCPYCGATNDDTCSVCVRCAQTLQVAARRVEPEALGDNAVMRMLLPVGRSWLAIAAGYAGLFSLIVFPAPLALLLGILAVRDLKKNPKKHGMGRAIFGIVMGALGTAILLLMLIGLRK